MSAALLDIGKVGLVKKAEEFIRQHDSTKRMSLIKSREGLRAFLLVVLLAPCLSGPEEPKTKDASRWQGVLEIEFRQVGTNVKLAGDKGYLAADGQITTTVRKEVLLEVKSRNPVLDRNGRQVGEFVILEDAGSNWRADVKGAMTYSGPPGRMIISATGSPGGKEEEKLGGWIYFSLSDDNPLKETLPSGTYQLQGSFSLPDGVLVTSDHGSGGTKSRSERFSGRYELGYFWWARPGDKPGRAESLLPGSMYQHNPETAARVNNRAGFHVFDAKPHSLREGRMTGQTEFSEVFGTIIRHEASLKWEIGTVRDIQATLHPVDKAWRPKGGFEPNSVRARATLDSSGTQGLFRFTLYNVSKEKGWCLNAGTDTGLDLQFAPGQKGYSEPRQEGEMQIIEGTESVSEAEVEVASLDCGGFARLQAEVNLDGVWYPIPAEDGKTYITIPYDQNENHIADYWEEVWGVSGRPAEEDEDAEPEGLVAGDGFSNYEEYRGFVVKTSWTDTYPGLKDVFVVDDVGWGVGHFTQLGLALHLIHRVEATNLTERVVNFNRSHASAGEQKAIAIVSGPLPNGVLGQVQPVVGTPNMVERVVIDKAKLAGASREKIAWVLAHELGHAVNIMHHGDFPSERECEGEFKTVGLPGQVHSGDANCVMKYVFPFRFYDPGDGKCYRYPAEDPYGTDYCRSKAGTGLNAGPPRTDSGGHPLPMAGDANWGPCRPSLAVKGKHTFGTR